MQRDTAWYLKKGSIWTWILLVGPLALPFVWLSPHFNRSTKVVLTLLLLVLTLLMIYGGVIMVDLARQYGIPLE